MKFNNFVKSSIAGAALITAASAQAAFVPLPSGITVLEDDNVEIVLDAQGNLKTSGVLEVGDRLRAVITFNAIQNGMGQEHISLGAPGLEVTGISEIEIASIDAMTGVIHFKPSAAFEAVYGVGAVASLFSQSNGDFSVGCNQISIAACESTATNGQHWLTAGFADDDDFWFASSTFPFNLSTGTIESVMASAATAKLGVAQYGLSILQNDTGYDFEQQFCFLCQGSDKQTDLIGSGDILGGAGLGNGYFARSDFDFQLDRIPEPASLAVFGAGLLALAGWRRRKSA